MTKKWFPVLGFTGFVTLIVGFLIQDCVLLLPKEIWLPGTQSFSIFGKIRFIYRMAYFFASKPVVAEFYWQTSSMCLPAFIFGFRFALALSLASLLLRHGRAGGYMRWAVVLCNLAWFPQGGSPLAPPPPPTQASTSLSTIAIPIPKLASG